MKLFNRAGSTVAEPPKTESRGGNGDGPGWIYVTNIISKERADEIAEQLRLRNKTRYDVVCVGAEDQWRVKEWNDAYKILPR